ncbi:hypothetical protein ABFX02_12G040900 [Erythranthe guttata]
MLSKQQRDLSSRVTESDFSSLWCSVPPCYGNFDKQSTAPKQPLVTIPSPKVMPIFVAQNPQLSYTTPNISVLEVADSRKPLTSSLETTYATPRQAAVGAPIDMAGKPSRTAIPHLARSIPLRLDDLFASIPFPCATDSISQYHQIGNHFAFAATDPTS